MNKELEFLAKELDLGDDSRYALRLSFGLSCARRAAHLLENPAVLICLQALSLFVTAMMEKEEFEAFRLQSLVLAGSHRGSASIDGCGHAAVSASYAVANALQGKAIQAASYSAYALVYANGGYGSTTQPEAFTEEFAWQINELKTLASLSPIALTRPFANVNAVKTMATLPII